MSSGEEAYPAQASSSLVAPQLEASASAAAAAEGSDRVDGSDGKESADEAAAAAADSLKEKSSAAPAQTGFSNGDVGGGEMTVANLDEDEDEDEDKELFGDSDEDEKKEDVEENATATEKTETKEDAEEKRIEALFEMGDDDDDDDLVGKAGQNVEEDKGKKSNLDDLMDSSDSDVDQKAGASKEEEQKVGGKKGGKKKKKNEIAVTIRKRDPDAVRLPIKVPPAIEIPDIPRVGSDIDIQSVRIPNMLHLDPYAFGEMEYKPAVEESRLQKLGRSIDFVMRWRFKKNANMERQLDENGSPIIESNSRFVQWSDGSIQLLIGDEVFDVFQQNSSNQLLFAMTEDHHDEPNTCMVSQGLIKTDMSIRPTSIESVAHREMEFKVKSRMIKQAKVKQFQTKIAPEKAQEQRLRAKDATFATMRKQRQKSNEQNRRSLGRWTQDYLEGEEDDEREKGKDSVRRLKEKMMQADEFDDEGEEFSDIDVEEEEEEEDSEEGDSDSSDGEKKDKKMRRKLAKQTDDSDEDEDEGQNQETEKKEPDDSSQQQQKRKREDETPSQLPPEAEAVYAPAPESTSDETTAPVTKRAKVIADDDDEDF